MGPSIFMIEKFAGQPVQLWSVQSVDHLPVLRPRAKILQYGFDLPRVFGLKSIRSTNRQ